MQDHCAIDDACVSRRAPEPRRAERAVKLVVLLTAAMMLGEIAVGYWTNSMALSADGWHMATHVGALGLTSVAYWVSRRYASDRAFAFGTGKVGALAGFTSAVILGIVAIVMVVESVVRLLNPDAIDFTSALPVAVVGLVVNLLSVWVLHDAHEHDQHHGHPHGAGHQHDHGLRRSNDRAHDHAHEARRQGAHDHNHRAAVLHLIADAFTSVLAIAALLFGRYLGWGWMDAFTGVVGGAVILKWSFGLSRGAAFELLDIASSSAAEDEIRTRLEAIDDVQVLDLHVWTLGRGTKSCIVTLLTSKPREVQEYRNALSRLDIAHLTIEVQRRSSEPGGAAPRRLAGSSTSAEQGLHRDE